MNKLFSLLCSLLVMAVMAVPAFAVDPVPADLYAAANTAGLSTGVSVILIAFIGIGLLFAARRLIGKSGIRG
jgi:hypothetical protein